MSLMMICWPPPLQGRGINPKVRIYQLSYVRPADGSQKPPKRIWNRRLHPLEVEGLEVQKPRARAVALARQGGA